jgi:hypothetical protein
MTEYPLIGDDLKSPAHRQKRHRDGGKEPPAIHHQRKDDCRLQARC